MKILLDFGFNLPLDRARHTMDFKIVLTASLYDTLHKLIEAGECLGIKKNVGQSLYKSTG